MRKIKEEQIVFKKFLNLDKLLKIRDKLCTLLKIRVGDLLMIRLKKL